MEMLQITSIICFLQTNIPDRGIVNDINSLINEGRGIVITISLIEDSKSKLVFLRVEEVVDTEDIEEVHFITRIESTVEVTLSELHIMKETKKYILVINGEVVSIVKRTHAVGNVVNSNTIVLEINNNTNGLSESKVFYFINY